ncbi:MAG: hypothetical protein ACRDRL_29795 [Sciscionella sp.]
MNELSDAEFLAWLQEVTREGHRTIEQIYTQASVELDEDTYRPRQTLPVQSGQLLDGIPFGDRPTGLITGINTSSAASLPS